MSITDSLHSYSLRPDLDSGPSPRQVHLGLSHAFDNKSIRKGLPKTYAWSDSFKSSLVSLDNFVDHVLTGNSWTPGHFKSGRSNATFLSAQTIALDADEGLSVAEALRHPFIAQYALLIHPTPSSSENNYRTRIVFVLSEPVEAVEGVKDQWRAQRWRTLVEALMRELGFQFDPASSKPAQAYHGSTNRIEEPYINLDAVLPLSLLGELTVDLAREDFKQQRLRQKAVSRPAVMGDSEARYAAATLRGELEKLASAPEGTRNTTLYKVSKNLFSCALGDWPGINEATVQHELETIVRGWPDVQKSLNTIENGKRDAEPRPMFRPERSLPKTRKTPEPSPSLATKRAYLQVNQQYVTLPTERTERSILIGSDVATGKTQTAIRAMRDEPGKVLYLTHREKLAGNFVESAYTAGVSVEHYKTLYRSEWRRVPRLALCINSLASMARDGLGVPQYDLLVIDEFEQLLEHVYGDAKTFKNNDALFAADTLKHVIRNAKRVLVMDAHLSELSIDFIHNLRGADDILHVHNTYTRERGRLVMYEHADAAIAYGKALVDWNQGVVAFACASRSCAARIWRDLSRQVGDPEQVLLLTAENAGGNVQRAFLQSPNKEISNYRAVARHWYRI